ncbi:diketogulonate reductase-like aldo/keto reductase [Massilia sp. UYP11]|uniref:aldo/keto reductase n=1 Tax=Massilia sp. UYP11 TaxID=1756385 RepID=UPI003D21FC43
MRKTKFPSGEEVPVLGQGTWGLGERTENRQNEIDALRFGIDVGMTLIDTAEMYGDGASEELVGKALEGRRAEAFIVDKVLPHNATRQGTVAACEKSLRRLKTDRIDLYLLHWRGAVPLEETLAAFDDLIRAGKIRYWGVSNFDVPDMEQVASLSDGAAVATNQVLYNLTRRGIEYDLMPWCEQRHIPVMAYSPLEQGRLMGHPVLRRIADENSATPAQIALAWVLRKENLIAVPKASMPGHVKQNRIALDIHLRRDELAELDRAFPPPDHKMPLEMI